MAFTRPKAAQIDFDLTNITDTLIRINSGESGDNTNDLGIVFERGNHTNAALVWDESADAFRFISTTQDATTTTTDINISAHHNLHVGTLVYGGLNDGTTTLTSTVAELNLVDGASAGTVTASKAVIYDSNGGIVAGGDINLNDADDQIIHGDASYKQKQYVLYGTTTNAIETEIFVGGTSNSRIPVETDTTVFYECDIAARRTDATGESGGWHLKSVADNFSGTVADVGSIYEVQVASDDANFAVDARADDTNDAIGIHVTGAAGKTIRWVAIVRTFEVAE